MDKPASPHSSATMMHSHANPSSTARVTAFAAPSGAPRTPHPAGPSEPNFASDFTAIQLLRVMSRLTQPGIRALSYFMLCREFGVRAVDGMVRGRILDLRWTEPVTKEGMELPEGATPSPITPGAGAGAASRRASIGVHLAASGSGTAIMESVDGDMIPISEREAGMLPDDEEIFGPKIVPATPILRYAMREVVAEYEDERSVSEYASLADVDEY
jgi:hypothetical protein